MSYCLLAGTNVPLLILLIVVAVLVVLTVATAVFSYLICNKTFKRSTRIASEDNPIYDKYQSLMQEGANYFLALEHKEVYITSYDNLKLCAYLHETPNSRGTVIFMHGYHGNPLTDFGPVLKKFKDLGFSLLLPYHRAHGKSEGKYITFGVKESKDCLAWAKYIAQNYPDRPIALHGVSMGGATVGMTSCVEDLPKEVKVITNDCGFTSPDAIISSVRKGRRLPFFPFQLYVRLYAKVFAKFSLKENNAADCYAKSKIPALFIHGESDDFVPYYMGAENYEKSNASDKIMITVKGAGHALAYITAPEMVTEQLTAFYNKHIHKRLFITT